MLVVVYVIDKNFRRDGAYTISFCFLSEALMVLE